MPLAISASHGHAPDPAQPLDRAAQHPLDPASDPVKDLDLATKAGRVG